MIDVRNILCPVDRSDVSGRALGVGAALAHWFDARVRVLEVVSSTLPPLAASPAAVQGLSIELRRAILDELERFAAPAREFGVPMYFEVEEGDVVTAVLEEAAELPADLIVIGTHGRSGFERFALGSVTEKILRRASCPVLTVPPGGVVEPSEGPPFRTIVAAVDFSEASLKGLEYAFSLAEEDNAQIIVAHVLDWPDETSLPPALAGAVANTRREWEGTKRAQLNQLVPQAVQDWCAPEAVLLVGSPARDLVTLARERDADLIVMGVHGRGALDLAIFGSTTHRVVRHAPCPVLTVRAPR
jgi:nucleotide-binding universal stress UspA family protein